MKEPGALGRSLERLTALVTSHTDSAVGEIGIDSRFTATVPMEKQLSICRQLLLLAQKHSRPAILHVVRSDGAMVFLLKDMHLDIPLLWHGFLGSLETARELAGIGCVISLSPSVWRQGTKLQAKLSAVDVPVLLETDYPWHYRLPGESTASYCEVLQRQYERYACAVGIPVAELEERCDGYAAVFTH